LGIGQGTRSTRSLGGVGHFQSSDSSNAEVYVVQAGDSYNSIQTKTNAPNRGILDERHQPISSVAALSPGTRLIIPGIRWVYAVQRDTLGSVARQHHIPVHTLATANGYLPNTTATLAFPVGSRILIPIH
jgi:hypothetical protein